MKSWYVTVVKGYTQIFQKRCLSAKEATDVFNEVAKKYLVPEYKCTREWF
jgi:hypothetical protein